MRFGGLDENRPGTKSVKLPVKPQKNADPEKRLKALWRKVERVAGIEPARSAWEARRNLG